MIIIGVSGVYIQGRGVYHTPYLGIDRGYVLSDYQNIRISE
jgi:hypothetical protein